MARLLVVYKKSQLELYQEHDPAAGAELQEREPALWDHFVRAHDENARAIDQVSETVRERGHEADFVYRADHESENEHDLVVSVGGDGTLLDVSHCVFERPLLGVIASRASVGYFGGADAATFGTVLDRFFAGDEVPVPLTRLQISVNGTPFAIPILNEILYSAIVPASVSRYVLGIGDVEEEHKSSGIWISTAAGSTAAIRSAGGRVMDPSDRRLQYVVREPFVWGGQTYRLLSGIVDGSLNLLAKMRTAALYLDGHREQIWLSLGDRVTIDRHPHPLRLVGFRRHAP